MSERPSSSKDDGSSDAPQERTTRSDESGSSGRLVVDLETVGEDTPSTIRFLREHAPGSPTLLAYRTPASISSNSTSTPSDNSSSTTQSEPDQSSSGSDPASSFTNSTSTPSDYSSSTIQSELDQNSSGGYLASEEISPDDDPPPSYESVMVAAGEAPPPEPSPTDQASSGSPPGAGEAHQSSYRPRAHSDSAVLLPSMDGNTRLLRTNVSPSSQSSTSSESDSLEESRRSSRDVAVPGGSRDIRGRRVLVALRGQRDRRPEVGEAVGGRPSGRKRRRSESDLPTECEERRQKKTRSQSISFVGRTKRDDKDDKQFNR